MAAGGYEWDIPYSSTSLGYVTKWKSELVSLAKSFVGASDNSVALAVAGAITREQLGNETVYPNARGTIWNFYVAQHSLVLSPLLPSFGYTDEDWETVYDYIKSADITKSSQLPADLNQSTLTNHFNNYTALLSDAGTIGKIRAVTAIDLLKNLSVGRSYRYD